MKVNSIPNFSCKGRISNPFGFDNATLQVLKKFEKSSRWFYRNGKL